MPPAPGAQFALVVGAQPRELVPGLRAVDRTEQRILDAGVHGVRVSRQPDQPRQREQGRITQRASPVARPAVARLKSGGVHHRRTRRPVRRSARHGPGDHTRHRPATRRRSAIAGSGRRRNPRFIGPRLTSAPPRVSPCLVALLSSGEPERVVAQRTTSRDSARHQPLAAQSVPQAVRLVGIPIGAGVFTAVGCPDGVDLRRAASFRLRRPRRSCCGRCLAWSGWSCRQRCRVLLGKRMRRVAPRGCPTRVRR